MSTFLLALGWAVVGAAGGFGIRRLNVWLARREELEVLTGLWRDLGPPILTAALFAVFAANTGVSRLLLIDSLWVLVLVQIIFFDLDHRLILDVVQVPAMVVALGLSFVTPHVGIRLSLAAGLGAGLLFLLLALGGALVFRTEAMGFGDVKLAALMGFMLGVAPPYWGVARAILYGIFLAGVISILLVLVRIKTMKDTLAYGPYLAAGALIVLYQMASH